VRLGDRIRKLLRLPPAVQTTTPFRRGPVDHVVILDGTMSSLIPGEETNAGLAYRMLREVASSAQLSLRYEQGTQWNSWRDEIAVAESKGINRQIRRAYGFIASRYRPGDRIFLLGYSRGAYAVRSLAGVIDRVGLLRAEHATVRNIRQIYRHYQLSPDSFAAATFAERFCHAHVEIEMVGVWDTVKALGNRLPVFWRYSQRDHAFHTATLGDQIRHGFHALAMDENRLSYDPILWKTRPDWDGVLEQVWFRGAHGDVGGQLFGYEAARPLANIPLVWMMDKVAGCGIALPEGWRDRFVQDATAPSVGTIGGWGMLFILRKKRVVVADASEHIHASAAGAMGRNADPVNFDEGA
jgi:uncharacterized protein (DUF2235 family)